MEEEEEEEEERAWLSPRTGLLIQFSGSASQTSIIDMLLGLLEILGLFFYVNYTLIIWSSTK